MRPFGLLQLAEQRPLASSDPRRSEAARCCCRRSAKPRSVLERRPTRQRFQKCSRANIRPVSSRVETTWLRCVRRHFAPQLAQNLPREHALDPLFCVTAQRCRGFRQVDSAPELERGVFEVMRDLQDQCDPRKSAAVETGVFSRSTSPRPPKKVVCLFPDLSNPRSHALGAHTSDRS
jgi:hypothetical protein